MHKYLYEGGIHTARDFFEARIRTGIRFPHPFHSFSHYLVRLWQWDTPDANYTIEILSEPGHQIFNNYDEALNCFNTLAEELPGRILEDVKLELVHSHLGIIYPLESKIVKPPVFAGGC
ncbi:MAG: hypothetical protein ACE5GL_05620 [Calditrichia bacterium]